MHFCYGRRRLVLRVVGGITRNERSGAPEGTLGGWALSAVRRKHAHEFVNQLAGERSQQTRDINRNVLRSVFREAIRDEQAGLNPGQLITMPPRKARERLQLPTREPLTKLLEVLAEPYRTLAFVALVSGCRIGGLCTLK